MKFRRFGIAAICCTLLLLTACQGKTGGRTSSLVSKNSTSYAVSEEASSQLSSDTQGSADVKQPSSGTQSSADAKDTHKISYNPSDYFSGEVPPDTEADALIQSPLYHSAVMYCIEDKQWLYRDGGTLKTAPASITKLLTASIALEYLSPDEIVTVGTEQEFVHSGSSLCYIGYGDQLTVKERLTGMLLNSGNDAAYTAAVCAARAMMPDERLSDGEAIRVFCDKMNAKAAAIGMRNSHFVNPDGWDEDLQYVTADDLVKLSVYALQYPIIREIVGTYAYDVQFVSGERIHWTNTNSLLNPDSSFYDKRCIGLKTGTTDNAGCCLAAAMQQNGKTYISIVTGCNTNDDRYDITLQLFNRTK